MAQFSIDTKNRQYQHVSYLLGEAEIAHGEGDNSTLRKEFADLLDKIALRLNSDGQSFDSHRELLESFQSKLKEQQRQDSENSKAEQSREKSAEAGREAGKPQDNTRENSIRSSAESENAPLTKREKDAGNRVFEEGEAAGRRPLESGDRAQQQKNATDAEKTQTSPSEAPVEDSLIDSMKKKAAALLAGLTEAENKGALDETDGSRVRENLMRAILLESDSPRPGQSVETPVVRELLLSPLLLQKAAETDLLGAVNEKNGALLELRALQNGSFGAFDRHNSLSGRENQTLAASTRRISQTAVVRMMERVESALKEAARSKDGKTISLRLDPPNLGHLKVDVSIRDSVLHARLTAESSQVTYLLRERAHDLQEMLRKLGLNVETVSVSVRSEDERAKNNNTSQQGGKEEKEDFVSLLDGVPAEKESDRAKSVASEKNLDHWIA